MLIESVEFLGFGSIVGERVHFDKDRLNLIIEPNQHGKSTMAEAIWAILYGFPSGQEGREERGCSDCA